MPKSDTIRARIEPKLKAEAERVLAALGLSASDAIRVFYKQVVLRKGLPFDVAIPNATTRKAMKDADAGRNLLGPFADANEMFRELGV
jgi:DNA-damage-inducible protein J